MTRPRPPARGRIPKVGVAPVRKGPAETQESTSEPREPEVTYLGADGRWYGAKGPVGADVAFPKDLAKYLALLSYPDPWAAAGTRLRVATPATKAKRVGVIAHWLSGHPHDPAWDQVHRLIQERHRCAKDRHWVCGCQLHQATCASCVIDDEAEADLRSILP